MEQSKLHVTTTLSVIESELIFLLPELILYAMFSHKFSSLFFSFFHVVTYAVFMYVVIVYIYIFLSLP